MSWESEKDLERPLILLFLYSGVHRDGNPLRVHQLIRVWAVHGGTRDRSYLLWYLSCGQTIQISRGIHSRTHAGKAFLTSDIFSMKEDIQTVASIWRENKFGYLSAKIICSEKRTVFRERSSRKTVSFEDAKRFNIQLTFLGAVNRVAPFQYSAQIVRSETDSFTH